MGTKCVRQLAAFIVLFTCCGAVADTHGEGTATGVSKANGTHPDLQVAELPPVEPKKCQELAQKLTTFKTEEKSLKEARVMLCSEASCMRLTDKIRKYTSTFTLHADLKAKTVELRHVKEADKEVGTPKATYSFFVESGDDTEKLLSCFGNKALKGTVVVQSFVKVPTEGDPHLKFRANVLSLEPVEPLGE